MNCIYRIESINKDIKEFYIGSTENLAQRITKHKYSCNTNYNKDYNIRLYKFIRDNGGFCKWKFVVEADTPNHNKEERLELEQYYKDLLNPQLNSYNAIGRDNERILETARKSKSKKVNCPHCNIELRKDCLNRHIKKSCKSI